MEQHALLHLVLAAGEGLRRRRVPRPGPWRSRPTGGYHEISITGRESRCRRSCLSRRGRPGPRIGPSVCLRRSTACAASQTGASERSPTSRSSLITPARSAPKSSARCRCFRSSSTRRSTRARISRSAACSSTSCSSMWSHCRSSRLRLPLGRSPARLTCDGPLPPCARPTPWTTARSWRTSVGSWSCAQQSCPAITSRRAEFETFRSGHPSSTRTPTFAPPASDWRPVVDLAKRSRAVSRNVGRPGRPALPPLRAIRCGGTTGCGGHAGRWTCAGWAVSGPAGRSAPRGFDTWSQLEPLRASHCWRAAGSTAPRARRGASRRCIRSAFAQDRYRYVIRCFRNLFGMRASSGSTTCSGCSACSGSRQAPARTRVPTCDTTATN